MYQALAFALLVTIGSRAVELAPLTPDQVARVERAFRTAQASEEQALLHRQSLERGELDQDLATRLRSFQERQAIALKAYMASTRDPRARMEFQNQQKSEAATEQTERESLRRSREGTWSKQLSDLRKRHAEHLRLGELQWKAGRKP